MNASSILILTLMSFNGTVTNNAGHPVIEPRQVYSIHFDDMRACMVAKVDIERTSHNLANGGNGAVMAECYLQAIPPSN